MELASNTMKCNQLELEYPVVALLAEVGQGLDDLGDECEGPGRTLVRIFLHQVEERRRHDGWTQEAQEQGGADESLTEVQAAAGATLLPPRGKHLLQLPGKDPGGGA